MDEQIDHGYYVVHVHNFIALESVLKDNGHKSVVSQDRWTGDSLNYIKM